MRCRAGMPWVVGLEEALEADLEMGSHLEASGRRKGAAADAAEVVGRMIGDGV